MDSLKDMTGKDALHLAKEKSGMTEAEVAVGINVSVSIIKRYLNREDAYLPSLEMIPRLCAALGNTLLLEWLEAQVDTEESAAKADMLPMLAAAASSLEMLRPFAEGTENLNRYRYKEVTGILDQVIFHCGLLREALSEDVPPSPGNGKVPPCPWWKFWDKIKKL